MSENQFPIANRWVLESSYCAVEPVCVVLRDLLQRHGFEKEIFNADLLLREAFTNAAGHGNKLDESKKVECSIRLFENMLEIEVTDEGPGFDWKKKAEESCAGHLSDSGRGLCIYRIYANEVIFNASGNRILLRKKLTGEECDYVTLSYAEQETDCEKETMNQDGIIVSFKGNLTATSADAIGEKLNAVLNENPSLRRVILDMERVSFMDSTGIAILIAFYKKIREKQGKLRLTNVPQALSRLLRYVNLDRHFDIVEKNDSR